MTDYSTRRSAVLALLVLATATGGTWCKKDNRSTYSENLAVHRRRFKVTQAVVKKSSQTTHKQKPAYTTPIYAITDQLDYLLARKRAVSEQVKYIQGYTIQVYVGGSRKEAFKIRNDLYTYYPAITPEITYDSPHYTVKLGKFLDTLEAYPAYAAIRKRMPQAIIRPIYFANTSEVFTNKQTVDRGNSGLSVPAANVHHQNEQE